MRLSCNHPKHLKLHFFSNFSALLCIFFLVLWKSRTYPVFKSLFCLSENQYKSSYKFRVNILDKFYVLHLFSRVRNTSLWTFVPRRPEPSDGLCQHMKQVWKPPRNSEKWRPSLKESSLSKLKNNKYGSWKNYFSELMAIDFIEGFMWLEGKN